MEGLIITNKGMEPISTLEVKELLNTKAEQDDYIVKFPIKNEEDLDLLSKKSRSASRVLYLLGEASIMKGLERTTKSFKKILNNVSLDKFLKKKIYRVDCQREGKHGFKSVELSKEIAEFLIEKGYENVTFKNPEVVIYIFIDDKKGYIGIDFSGNISKRDYKIFNNSRSIKGNIAYALVRESGYDKGKTLVNPFCLSGEILIEAALFAKGNIFGYDSERNMVAARKNSKIAGINKLINFERTDKKADAIIARLPETSKHKRKEFIEKIYKKFFEECKKTLKKNGRIVIISKDIDIIKKEKFKILKEFTIYSGEQGLKIFILKNAV